MRSLLSFALVTLCLLPAGLAAAEPARGTVIMVSSIGGWVLFSSGSMVLRGMRKARQKAADEAAAKKDPNA